MPTTDDIDDEDSDYIIYREPINVDKINVFANAVHENISIPTIDRIKGEAIFAFIRRQNISHQVLSIDDRIEVLSQLYNMTLFLEANDYQIDRLRQADITFDNNHVLVHNMEVRRCNRADNTPIVTDIWKEFNKPKFNWKPSQGRLMNQSYIIDTEDSRRFLEQFR